MGYYALKKIYLTMKVKPDVSHRARPLIDENREPSFLLRNLLPLQNQKASGILCDTDSITRGRAVWRQTFYW